MAGFLGYVGFGTETICCRSSLIMNVVCIQELISKLCYWMMMYARTTMKSKIQFWMKFIRNSDLMSKSKRRYSFCSEVYSCMFRSSSCESGVSVNKVQFFELEIHLDFLCMTFLEITLRLWHYWTLVIWKLSLELKQDLCVGIRNISKNTWFYCGFFQSFAHSSEVHYLNLSNKDS